MWRANRALIVFYILDWRGEPEPYDEASIINWSLWHQTDERRVVRQQEWVGDRGKTIYVSTIFLGIDHAWDNGPPVLWETMAWVGDNKPITRRYRSRAAAIAGHAALVQRLGGTPLDEPQPAAPADDDA